MDYQPALAFGSYLNVCELVGYCRWGGPATCRRSNQSSNVWWRKLGLTTEFTLRLYIL